MDNESEIKELLKEVKAEVRDLRDRLLGTPDEPAGIAVRVAVIEQTTANIKKFLWAFVGAVGTGGLGILGKAMDLV
jgi:hypothetical protein